MSKQAVIEGDCLTAVRDIPNRSVDLVYLDPPFFTQKTHRLTTRSGTQKFSFRDIWEGESAYADHMYKRLESIKPKLKDTGSIFFHCDKTASHIVRLMLDSIFGEENFRSEIIWSFKRWSNSQKGLLPTHQTILYYSISDRFKFNTIYTGYSETTNIDQILQRRARDLRGKAVYAKDSNGEVIIEGSKKGVPLGDVWEIPFLNPKAKERVGYPTQKPILLLERIIELSTDPGDTVLDPFCGSGTTLVAAKMLNRCAIGIDDSPDAVRVARERLEVPLKSSSRVMELGREAYSTHETWIKHMMQGVDYNPVQRNAGIDGILKETIVGRPVFIRVQRSGEQLSEAVAALKKAAVDKGKAILVVVRVYEELLPYMDRGNEVFVIDAPSMQLGQLRQAIEKDEILASQPSEEGKRLRRVQG